VASQIKLAIVSGDVRDITKGNERVVNSCRSVSDKRRKPLEKPKKIQRNTKIKTQPNTAVGIIASYITVWPLKLMGIPFMGLLYLISIIQSM